MNRIQSHKRNKNFWNYALVFVEKGDFLNLNGTHAKIIESALLDKARQRGVVVLDNNTGSNAPRVLDSDKYAADTWMEEIVIMTKLLGLPFFASDSLISKPDPSTKEILMTDESPLNTPVPLSQPCKEQKEKPFYIRFYNVSSGSEEDVLPFYTWRNLEEEVCKKIIKLYGIEEFCRVVLDKNNKKFHTKKKNMFGTSTELMIKYFVLAEEETYTIFMNTNNSSETILSVCKELINHFPNAGFELVYEEINE